MKFTKRTRIFRSTTGLYFIVFLGGPELTDIVNLVEKRAKRKVVVGQRLWCCGPEYSHNILGTDLFLENYIKTTGWCRP